MNKTISRALSALLLTGVIATSSQAFEQAETFLNIAATQSTISSDRIDESNWGAMIEASMLYQTQENSGGRLGWSSSYNYYNLDAWEHVTFDDDMGFNVDGMLVAGYAFENLNDIPLILYAGVGYSIGQISGVNTSGLAYKAGIKFDFAESAGIILEYKSTEMNLDTGWGVFDGGSMDQINFGVSINF